VTKRYLRKKKLLIPIKDERKRREMLFAAKRQVSESLGMLVLGYLLGNTFPIGKGVKPSDVILKAEDIE